MASVDPVTRAPRRRGLALLLAASLLLNAALLSAASVHVYRHGGLPYVKEKLGLVPKRFKPQPFQLARLDRFQKLPRCEGAVVFAGDSHVAATPYAELFSPFKNRGIGGDTTAGLLARLDEIVRHKPRCVFLQVGCNDVASEIPVAESVENYRRILRRLRAESPGVRLFALSVPPTNHKIRQAPVDRNPMIRALNEGLRALASAEGATFIDLTPVLADGEGNLKREYAVEDGIHVNLDGALAVCELLKRHVSDISAEEFTTEARRHGGGLVDR